MTSDPRKRHPIDIPPVYFVLAILAMLALHRFLPIVDLVDRPWAYLGLIPVVAGIGLAIWAERLFSHAGTGVRPFTPSTTLVRAGPYRFTRNPMYLGMILVLLGGWLLAGSISSALVIPLFFWWINSHFVLPEEGHMERHFGDAFLDFKRSTRRWL